MSLLLVLVSCMVVSVPMAHKYAVGTSTNDLHERIAELLYLERAALEPSSRTALESHVRCYLIFSRSIGVDAFPVTFTSIGLFLIQYCRRFGHTARSIPVILSHLRRANRSYSDTWLDGEGEYRLRDLITSLRKHDQSPPMRKLPITHDVMDKIQAAGDTTDLRHFQHISVSRVARDALLRGKELIKLRVGEMRWNADRTKVTITIHHSKANKFGPPELVTNCDYGSSSGVAYLREYFRIVNLDNAPPGRPLWPLIAADNSVQWHHALPKTVFIRTARTLLAKAGFPATRFAGHSYRSGGATDLWESHRCRPLTLKLHGRWRSDAYRLYIRDNPHKTAEEVALAMAFFDEATREASSAAATPSLGGR